MRPMVLFGVILIVLGIAGLLYGGFTYVEDRDTADLGIAKVTVTDKEHVNIPPILGGVVLAAGVVMIVLAGKRAAA